MVSGPDSAVTASKLAITHNTGSAGNLIIDNNIINGLNWKGINSGAAFRNVGAGTVATVYENTINGKFLQPVLRSSGTVNLSNNFMSCSLACSGTITKNYDVYKVNNESETNGTLTTQNLMQLFTDTTPALKRNWNFTPIAGSDLIGKGTPLASAYDGDLLHTNGTAWRPVTTTWDAGAIEYQAAGGSKKKTSGKFSFKIRFPIFPPSGNSN
jgi:hypothetical protein